jgi:hypothetical protein
MGPFSSVSFSLSATVLVLEIYSLKQSLDNSPHGVILRLAIRLILFAAPLIFVTVCGVLGVGCGVWGSTASYVYFLFFRFRKSVGQSFCLILEDQEGREGETRFTGITVLNNRSVDSIAVRHSGVCQVYNYRAFGLNPFDYFAL